MKRLGLSIVVTLVAAASASATDLNLSVRSGGQGAIVVTPGATITYQVVGELTDSLSDGLAMFSFDLAYSAGAMTPAAVPASTPLNHFAPPLGLSNPAGFGGTVVGQSLVQVGGAQNTINNSFAPVPTGAVLAGVAQPGQPIVLASGTVAAPYKVGTFTLSASSVFANVLAPGQTGVPFWKVLPAAAGAIQNLTIEVSAISSNVSTVSVTAAGSQVLSIDAGPANAGRTYWMLGTLSGTTPGTTLQGGLVLPLNSDGYFQYTRTHLNSAILSNSFGTLDGQGRATVTFTPNRRFVGLPVNHAFILTNPVDFASEAEPCTVVP